MTPDKQIKDIDQEARLGWMAANELLRPFGAVAANFSEAIRLLVHHYECGSNCLPLSAENHIVRLLKNNTIKATYYYLTKVHRPHILEPGRLIDERSLYAAYTPFEHAAILSYCYLARTMSRKTEREDWGYIETPLYEALITGGIMGEEVPDVGLGFGLLSRGLRYLAFAAFLRENRRGFKEYRLHLKAKDLAFDIAFEERYWQTNNIQLAAILLERMGFKHEMGMDFVAAFERNKDHQPSELYGVRFSMAEALIDSYMETGEILERVPGWVGKEKQISVETRGAILSKLNKVMGDKNRIDWLSKGSASISPELSPELFVGM